MFNKGEKMILKQTTRGDIVILTITETSELGINNTEELWKELLRIVADEKTKIVLNMKNISTVVSRTIANLARLTEDLRKRGGDLKIVVDEDSTIRGMAESYRVANLLAIFDTEQEAVTALETEGGK